VQGGRDLVCPPRTAIELAGRLPRAELRLVQDGGHSATGPEMAQALRRATDDLREALK
jgi:proline iminopeptidase